MQLTGQQMVERGIIGNFDPDRAVQQQGIDLRLKRVFELNGEGYVGRSSTQVPKTREIYPTHTGDADVFVLEPGYYEIQLEENCTIPSTIACHLKTRSSLVRCGAEIRAGQFDGGFETDQMGCFLKVERTMSIELGARVCQAICLESDPVENTYNGQFQNDKQRADQ